MAARSVYSSGRPTRALAGPVAFARVAAFALPLAAYLATLAPSITWRNGGADSGDVVTGAIALGVLHPPGYALFVALAHGLVVGAPWLEPARTVNLLCAVLGAAAAAVAFRTGLAVAGERHPPPVAAGAALAAALAAALGPLWWQQSNLATVHALSLLLGAVLVDLAWRLARAEPGGRGLFALGLVSGLATTHQLTLAAIALAAVASTVGVGPTWRRQPGRARPALVGLALGLLPWAALPAIAAARPTHGWGDPTTLVGFFDLVLARPYWGYLEVGSPGDALRRGALAVWTVARALGPLGLPAALVGLALLWESRPAWVRLVAAVAALEGAFFVAYGARDVESHLMPICLTLLPAGALGMAEAAQLAVRVGGRAGGWAAALAVLALVGGLGSNWAAMDLSRDRGAVDYGRAALAEAPPHALLISETDEHTFALWYAQQGLGLRPDVAIVDRWMLEWEWYRARIAARHPDLRLPADGRLSGPGLAAGLVTDRPVVVTDVDLDWNAPLEAGTLLWRIRREDASRP